MRYVDHAARVGLGISIFAYGFSVLLRGSLIASQGVMVLLLVALGGGIAAYGTFTGVEAATRRARGAVDDGAPEGVRTDAVESPE